MWVSSSSAPAVERPASLQHRNLALLGTDLAGQLYNPDYYN
jgi:hypothetical protein